MKILYKIENSDNSLTIATTRPETMFGDTAVAVNPKDDRYENFIALRAVTSMDGMTAEWYDMPSEVLKLCSTRIVNEVKGINRVLYDFTTKPPGTIEWE